MEEKWIVNVTLLWIDLFENSRFFGVLVLVKLQQIDKRFVSNSRELLELFEFARKYFERWPFDWIFAPAVYHNIVESLVTVIWFFHALSWL